VRCTGNVWETPPLLGVGCPVTVPPVAVVVRELPLSTCVTCLADIVWVPTPACSAAEQFTVSVPTTVTGEGDRKLYDSIVHAGCGLAIRRR
jgi:hypothetical protein